MPLPNQHWWPCSLQYLPGDKGGCLPWVAVAQKRATGCDKATPTPAASTHIPPSTHVQVARRKPFRVTEQV